jgi:hypothetical protein
MMHLSRRHSARVALVLFAIAGSIGNAGFSRLMAEQLSPTTDNDLRTILGVLNGVGLLVIGLQLVVVGAAGETSTAARLFAGTRLRQFLAACVAVAGASGLITAFVVRADTASKVVIGAQVAVTMVAMLASVAPRSELLAGERWVRLGILMVVAPAVRLVVGALVLSGSRADVAMVPVVAAECTAAVVAFGLRSPIRASAGLARLSARTLWIGALASVGLMMSLMLSSAARSVRLGSDADLFNSAATLARPILFAPLTVTLLWFPAMARSPLGTARLRRAFLVALGWTALLSTTAAAVVIAFPDELSRLLLGHSDTPVTVTRLLAITWMLSAISMVPLLLHIAHGSRLALGAWAPLVLLVPGHLLADSAEALAWTALVAAAAMFATMSVPAVLRVQPIVHARRAPSRSEPTESTRGVTVVVPCYNPGPVVVNTLEAIAAELEAHGAAWQIIAVTDGSSDGSDDLIDAAPIRQVTHIRHERNRGKGAALRTGFAEASTELVAFIDADGDLSPTLLTQLLATESSLGGDIVFGSKLHPASQVHASLLRRAYSRGYQLLIRLLFQLDVRDTQTGIKLIRRRVLDAVLPSLTEDGFALDLELFVAARANGFTSFVEVPVVLRREAGSTISVKAIWQMVTDTFRLFWRAKVTLQYLRSASSGDSARRPDLDGGRHG